MFGKHENDRMKRVLQKGEREEKRLNRMTEEKQREFYDKRNKEIDRKLERNRRLNELDQKQRHK